MIAKWSGCNGPATSGVNLCTQDSEANAGRQGIEDTAKRDLIFEKLVEEKPETEVCA
jgi:hypothetical protein